MKNWFVNFENGENVLVYSNQSGVTAHAVRLYAEKVTGVKVVEVYHIPQEELQYYCIDGRVWIDTPKLAVQLLTIAGIAA